MGRREALIRDFVNVLYPPEFWAGMPSADGGEPFLTLSVREANGPLRSRHFRIGDPALEVTAATLDARGCTVYHGVALHGADLGIHARGTKKDIVALPGFWCDVDLKGPGHASQNLPPSIEAFAEHVLIRLEHEPSIAVSTGGGFHLYFLFERPLIVTDANRDAAARASKAFQAQIIALAATVFPKDGGPWHCDDTSDLTRILRPVGTTNRKIGRIEPAPVEWVGDPMTAKRYKPESLGLANVAATRTVAGLFGSGTAPPTVVTSASTTPPAAPSAEWSYEATREAILGKLARNRRDERREIIACISAGTPFAQPGARDATLQRVASWLAFYCCDGDPEALADVLLPSLEAMEAESPNDFISYEAALSKIVRAQNDARAKERTKAEAEARIMARVFGVARSAKAPATTPDASTISEPSPRIEAAPDATSTAGNGAAPMGVKIQGSAADIGTKSPEGSGLAVVPGEASPGRAALKPLPWTQAVVGSPSVA